jgi:hypothetical protein
MAETIEVFLWGFLVGVVLEALVSLGLYRFWRRIAPPKTKGINRNV